MESIGIGTIKITCGRVVVSDPCYERDSWCAGAIENFPNGEYDCEVDVGIADEWGKRVFRMRMLKQGLNLSQCEFRHTDVLPVDCALMGFFDDAYLDILSRLKTGVFSLLLIKRLTRARYPTSGTKQM